MSGRELTTTVSGTAGSPARATSRPGRWLVTALVAVGVWLLLAAALQAGEANLLAGRGIEAPVLRDAQGGYYLVDGTAWPTDVEGTTVVFDPAAPGLHAADPGAHAAGAWPPVLAGAVALALAAAAGLSVRRRPIPRPAPAGRIRPTAA